MKIESDLKWKKSLWEMFFDRWNKEIEAAKVYTSISFQTTKYFLLYSLPWIFTIYSVCLMLDLWSVTKGFQKCPVEFLSIKWPVIIRNNNSYAIIFSASIFGNKLECNTLIWPAVMTIAMKQIQAINNILISFTCVATLFSVQGDIKFYYISKCTFNNTFSTFENNLFVH